MFWSSAEATSKDPIKNICYIIISTCSTQFIADPMKHVCKWWIVFPLIQFAFMQQTTNTIGHCILLVMVIGQNNLLRLYVLGTLSKKNDIIWEFFPNVGPPHPLLLGTPYQKKIQCLFCILEPKEHFFSSKKGNISKTILVNLLKVLGIRTPPPFWEKFPNNPVFFLQQDNSDNFEYP